MLKIPIVEDLAERGWRRREVMERHRTRSSAAAWDLDFWQRRMPEERLSVLVAIHRDVSRVEGT